MDIYSLLSKYFLGEATEKEKEAVESFKKNNSKEFTLLSKVWERDNIKVKAFNTQKAWNKMGLDVSVESKPKVVPIGTILRSVAAIGLLLLGAFLVYRQFAAPETIEMLLAQTSTEERNRQVKLSDGTTIFLNRNSKLHYPKTFASDGRRVSLEGEAFFDVAENPKKPFIIETTHSKITVLGTSFNVNSNQQKTKISVKTGKVKVNSVYNRKFVTLTAGVSAVSSSKELIAFKTQDNNVTAWKTGNFVFKEKPINEVIQALNTYYNGQIESLKQNANCSFTGTFKEAALPEVLKVIQLSCGIKLKTK